jgi:hypothetical protein
LSSPAVEHFRQARLSDIPKAFEPFAVVPKLI